MLKRIRIRGYKSFRDEEVRLEPLTVLFGASAAGKSNFLEALRLLARLGTEKTIRNAFESLLHVASIEAFSLGEGGVPALSARSRLTLSIEADIELSDVAVAEAERQIEEVQVSGSRGGGVRERNLRYRVKVEMRPAKGELRVADEHLSALNRNGEPKQGRPPFITWEKGRALLRRERPGNFIGFERNLDHALLSARHYPAHFPHLMAARAELERWKFFRLEPDCMRLPSTLKQTRSIGSRGEDISSFLHTLRLSEPKQFRAVEKALRMLIPSIDGIKTAINDYGEVEFHIVQDGVPVSAPLLPGGALRLLGLLATSGVGGEASSLTGIEEPENGIHPRFISRLAEMLKTRAATGPQCIVVTHSPLLLGMLPEKFLFAARRHNRRVRIDPAADWGSFSYSPKSADRLSLLPVSERILRGDFDNPA